MATTKRPAPAAGRQGRQQLTGRAMQEALVAQWLYMQTTTSRKAANVAAPHLLDFVADMLASQAQAAVVSEADLQRAISEVASLGHSCALVTAAATRLAPVWPLLALAGQVHPQLRTTLDWERAVSRATGIPRPSERAMAAAAPELAKRREVEQQG